MLPGTSSAFAVMTWMPLIFLPYGSTSCNSVIPSGKTLISARGLALVRGLDAALMLDAPHRHARSLLDIPVSAASMKRLLRFRMGCHRLPRDDGSWARPEVPRLDRVCQLCGAGTLGDERHLVFECPGLLCFREQWSHLFEGPQTMQAFMWQEDLIGIVRFITACLHKMISLVWLEEM